jgi:hypothetical protein
MLTAEPVSQDEDGGRVDSVDFNGPITDTRISSKLCYTGRRTASLPIEAPRRAITSLAGRAVTFVRSVLEAQVRKSGMIYRARTIAIPLHLPIGLRNRQVIDAGKSLFHEAVGIKLPIFVAIGTKPVS